MQISMKSALVNAMGFRGRQFVKSSGALQARAASEIPGEKDGRRELIPMNYSALRSFFTLR